MIFFESNVNPLKELIGSIPSDGIVIAKESLDKIALFFSSGGIRFESYGEVLHALHAFCDWYNLTTLEPYNDTLILKRIDNGHQIS
jgi:hypothetical protein